MSARLTTLEPDQSSRPEFPNLAIWEQSSDQRDLKMCLPTYPEFPDAAAVLLRARRLHPAGSAADVKAATGYVSLHDVLEQAIPRAQGFPRRLRNRKL